MQADGLPKRASIRWWLHACLGLVAVSTTLWMRSRPEWVETYYSLGWYQKVRSTLEPILGGVGFSVGQVMTIGILFWVLKSGFRRLKEKGRHPIVRIGGALAAVPIAAIWIYAAYLVMWGGNQYRSPLEARLGWSPEHVESTWLEPVCRELAEALGRDRPGLTEAGFAVWSEAGELDPRVLASLHSFGDRFSEFGEGTPALRAFTTPGLWGRFGISGIFFPLTGEPHIVAEGPACGVPFRALHEIAHQRGYAREDEANFLSWWICQDSGDAHYRYSANLQAWSYCIGALRRQSPELARELASGLPLEVHADRKALRDYWRSFEGPMRAVGTQTNDLFLKFQGQVHGVRSYGRMVRLILGEYAERNR